MQIISIGDNLHEQNLFSGENKKAENFTQSAKY